MGSWFKYIKDARGKLKKVLDDGMDEDESNTIVNNITENEVQETEIFSVTTSSTSTKILRIEIKNDKKERKSEVENKDENNDDKDPNMTNVNAVITALKELVPSLTLLHYDDGKDYEKRSPPDIPVEFKKVFKLMANNGYGNKVYFTKSRYDDDLTMAQIKMEANMKAVLDDNGAFLYEHKMPIERTRLIGSIYLISPYSVNMSKMNQEINEELKTFQKNNAEFRNIAIQEHENLIELEFRKTNKMEVIQQGVRKVINYPVIDVRCQNSKQRFMVNLITKAKLQRDKFGQFAQKEMKNNKDFKDLIMFHLQCINKKKAFFLKDINISLMTDTYNFTKADGSTEVTTLFLHISGLTDIHGERLIDSIIDVEVFSDKWRIFVMEGKEDQGIEMVKKALTVVMRSNNYIQTFGQQNKEHVSLILGENGGEVDPLLNTIIMNNIPKSDSTTSVLPFAGNMIRSGVSYRDITAHSTSSPTNSMQSGTSSQISILQEQQSQFLDTIKELQLEIKTMQEEHTKMRNYESEMKAQMAQQQVDYQQQIMELVQSNRSFMQEMINERERRDEEAREERAARNNEMNALVKQLAESGRLKPTPADPSAEKRIRDEITATPVQPTETYNHSGYRHPPPQKQHFHARNEQSYPEEYPPNYPQYLPPSQPIFHMGQQQMMYNGPAYQHQFQTHNHPMNSPMAPTHYAQHMYQPTESQPNFGVTHELTTVPENRPNDTETHLAQESNLPTHSQGNQAPKQSSLSAAYAQEPKINIKSLDRISQGETPIRNQYDKPPPESPAIFPTTLTYQSSNENATDKEGQNDPADPPDLAGQRL